MKIFKISIMFFLIINIFIGSSYAKETFDEEKYLVELEDKEFIRIENLFGGGYYQPAELLDPYEREFGGSDRDDSTPILGGGNVVRIKKDGKYKDYIDTSTIKRKGKIRYWDSIEHSKDNITSSNHTDFALELYIGNTVDINTTDKESIMSDNEKKEKEERKKMAIYQFGESTFGQILHVMSAYAYDEYRETGEGVTSYFPGAFDYAYCGQTIRFYEPGLYRLFIYFNATGNSTYVNFLVRETPYNSKKEYNIERGTEKSYGYPIPQYISVAGQDNIEIKYKQGSPENANFGLNADKGIFHIYPFQAGTYEIVLKNKNKWNPLYGSTYTIVVNSEDSVSFKQKMEMWIKKWEAIVNSLNNPNALPPSSSSREPLVDDGKLVEIGNKIIGPIQAIGSLVSVIAIIIIGIRYMLGSIEEKARYKEVLLPYFIGAIMVFGITNILAIVYNLVAK